MENSDDLSLGASFKHLETALELHDWPHRKCNQELRRNVKLALYHLILGFLRSSPFCSNPALQTSVSKCQEVSVLCHTQCQGTIH